MFYLVLSSALIESLIDRVRNAFLREVTLKCSMITTRLFVTAESVN